MKQCPDRPWGLLALLTAGRALMSPLMRFQIDHLQKAGAHDQALKGVHLQVARLRDGGLPPRQTELVLNLLRPGTPCRRVQRLQTRASRTHVHPWPQPCSLARRAKRGKETMLRGVSRDHAARCQPGALDTGRAWRLRVLVVCPLPTLPVVCLLLAGCILRDQLVGSVSQRMSTALRGPPSQVLSEVSWQRAMPWLARSGIPGIPYLHQSAHLLVQTPCGLRAVCLGQRMKSLRVRCGQQLLRQPLRERWVGLLTLALVALRGTCTQPIRQLQRAACLRPLRILVE